MCRWGLPRLDKRIDAIKDELRALEAHHGGLRELACHEAMAGASDYFVHGERKGESKRRPLHFWQI